MWKKKYWKVFTFFLVLIVLIFAAVFFRQKIRIYFPNFLKIPFINQKLPLSNSNPIIVTLGFDDGVASQYKIRHMLANRDMHAVFYINTGLIGSPGYLTWKQLDRLHSDGNEIGSHAVYHPNLTNISLNEIHHEICDSRITLINRGYETVSFAYPGGQYNREIEKIVAECGYSNARGVDGQGEEYPPTNPYGTKILYTVTSDTTLEELKNKISSYQKNGSWLQIVFHDICYNCTKYSFTSLDILGFLNFLETQQALGKIILTPNQVITGSIP